MTLEFAPVPDHTARNVMLQALARDRHHVTDPNELALHDALAAMVESGHMIYHADQKTYQLTTLGALLPEPSNDP